MQAAVVLSEAMDIPTLAEADGPKSMQRQAVPKGEVLEPQGNNSRPVWAGPSWPIASSHGGARSMLSGTSPYGKSIDMADALHFSDTGDSPGQSLELLLPA